MTWSIECKRNGIRNFEDFDLSNWEIGYKIV